MKIRNYLSIAIMAVLSCSASSVMSQISYSGNAAYNPMGLQVYTLLLKVPGKQEEDAVARLLREEAADLYNSRALPTFGSYYNPYDDTFRIISRDGVQYTKLQVVNDETSKTVLSIEIRDVDKVLDVTMLAEGRYTLILTDDAMNIFSESLTIY